MSIANTILDKIGGTPLVRINKLNQGGAEVVVKVESFNPGGSVKDRIAFAMIEAAEQAGVLKPGALIIEPTSGNTGVGLAFVSAVKGYHLILTMPDTMSMERRNLLHDPGGLVIGCFRLHVERLRTRRARGDEVLFDALGVLGDERVHGGEDFGCRAVVPRHEYRLRRRELLVEIEEEADIGAAP